MSKNYLAYVFLVLAALFWSGNFIVGKFATLFEVPPLTLNVFRWISVWLILIPFTYKEIFNSLPYIKKNWLVISFMGIITISTFNSVVYFALNYTQVVNAVLMLAAIPAATIVIFCIIYFISSCYNFTKQGSSFSIKNFFDHGTQHSRGSPQPFESTQRAQRTSSTAARRSCMGFITRDAWATPGSGCLRSFEPSARRVE